LGGLQPGSSVCKTSQELHQHRLHPQGSDELLSAPLCSPLAQEQQQLQEEQQQQLAEPMEAVDSAEHYLMSDAGEGPLGQVAATAAAYEAGTDLPGQSPMLGSIPGCSAPNGMVAHQQQWSGSFSGLSAGAFQLGPSALPLSAAGAAACFPGGSARPRTLSPEAAAAARASANTKYMSIPSSRPKDRMVNGKAKVAPEDAAKVSSGRHPPGQVAAAAGGPRAMASRGAAAAAGHAGAVKSTAGQGPLRRAASAGVAAATAAAGGLTSSGGGLKSRQTTAQPVRTHAVKSEERRGSQQQQGKGKGGAAVSSSSTPASGSKSAAKQQRVPPEVANLSRVELGTAHLNKKRCRTWIDDLDQPQEVEFMPGCVRCSFAKVCARWSAAHSLHTVVCSYAERSSSGGCSAAVC
jgi:hypothetical protein